MSENRKIAAILVADVVGYSRLAGADEERTLSRLRGLRSDLHRPSDSSPSRAGRQAHRRWIPRRISQRGRRRALRDRGADRHGRTQRRSAGRSPHRAPHRGPSRRRGRGGRRRSDGRWRQYRRAARRDLPAGRDLPLRTSLLAGERSARSGGHGSRPDPTQEHRRADPDLFGASRRAGRSKARTGPGAGKIRPTAPLDGRPAVRQHRRRRGAGAFRRRGHGEPDDRSFAHSRLARDRAQHCLHLQGQGRRSETDRARVERALCPRGQRAARRKPHARQCPAHRRRNG